MCHSCCSVILREREILPPARGAVVCGYITCPTFCLFLLQALHAALINTMRNVPPTRHPVTILAIIPPDRDADETLLKVMVNEPHHDKTNKMACAPSEASVLSGHPLSLMSPCCPHDESLDP